MKRKNMLFAALACALAFCLALVGCGGTSSDPEEPYVGYWTFVEGEVDGEDMGDMIDQLAEIMGTEANFILHLEAGGKGELDMFGDVEDITWDVEAMTITVSDEDQSFSLDGEQLRMESGDDYLLFDKSDEDLSDTIEKDKEAYEESVAGGADVDTAEATTQTIDPITVADDDVCTITITELATDDWGDVGFTVEMVNNTDGSIVVMIPASATAVNGTMAELYGSSILLAGTNSTEFFYFMSSEGVVTSIDDLVNVQTTFEVYDYDSYDDLGSYTVTINATDDAPTTTTTSTTDVEEAAEDIDPVTVADDDVCTIIVTQKEVDGDGDAGFIASVTNNGDTTFTLYSPTGSTTVDGVEHELWTYNASDVEAGESRAVLLYFEDLSSIDDLVNVQLTLVPYDSDTWDDIASYTAVIP